jgi:hypothetical protein
LKPTSNGHRWRQLVRIVAARVTDRLWEMSDIVEMVDAALPKPGKHGPYKHKLQRNFLMHTPDDY